MPEVALTRKLTITVSSEFYEGLVRSAGQRKIGAFIEKHLRPIVASKENLDAGYRAMAADVDREEEAKDWCNALCGKTLNHDSF